MFSISLFMGLVIGSNNLAAALAMGILGNQERWWRILVVFGAFEFLMPLVGDKVACRRQNYAEAEAGILLCLLAGYAWFELM